MTKPLRILSASLLALLGGTIFLVTPLALADQRLTEAAPTLLVLYKDQSNNFITRTDKNGEQLLDIRHGQPIIRANITETLEQLYSSEKRKRSTHEQMARILIPFGVAALAFGGISDHRLDYTGTNLQTNFGHYMVLATVNNLSQYVDEATAELLGEHHLGGVIPPEWAAKGAVAVLMLGMGGVQSVGTKLRLSVGKSISFFAQSHTIDSSSLMLGEVSGQALDRIVSLSPGTRKIVTTALSGAATGGLYYQLTAIFGGRARTVDLHSKISDTTLLNVSAVTMPFLEDFIGLATNDPLWKHLGAYSMLETISLAAAGGLYALVSHCPPPERTGFIYLSRLLAGSFIRLAGLNTVEIMGDKTIRLLYTDKNQKLTTTSHPALKAIVYLSISLAANGIYHHYGIASDKPLLWEALLKFRDGVYIAAIANGMTGLLGDFIQTIEE